MVVALLLALTFGVLCGLFGDRLLDLLMRFVSLWS